MPTSAISAASRSRPAWLDFVLPALLLNYFGQGALVLSDPWRRSKIRSYRMVPDWALMPLVVLATAATVIASQAVITGAFSLIRQAVQLGLLPRFEVRYTSETHAGQIYLPRGQPDAVARRHPAGAVVPHLLWPRFGLWHRRLHDHGRRRHHGLCRDLEIVELARGERGGLDPAARRRRHGLLQRQPAEAARRRLGAAAVRRSRWP